MQVLVLPQHAIVESTRRLLKGQRHKKRERVNHRKESEKRDDKYKHVYPCKGQWKGEDHREGREEWRLWMVHSHWKRGTTGLYSDQRK